MNGQIIRIISNLYTVKIDDMLFGCRARGVFRNKGITPLVGDNVIVAANAVVVSSFPSNCLIGGVPAKILRQL